MLLTTCGVVGKGIAYDLQVRDGWRPMDTGGGVALGGGGTGDLTSRGTGVGARDGVEFL